MKDFMNKYFSILFLFVAAATFVACNYNGQDSVDSIDVISTDTVEIIDYSIPFEMDSIVHVRQLLDSLEAVQ